MTGAHILVIDDERALRQILTGIVSKAGYSVDEAATAKEASAKLSRDDIDIALCDIKLPDGSGLDLLRNSRSGGSETAFVMVTAFASLETAIEALRAGAADYMIKPVHSEELLHRVAKIEQLRGLRQENTLLRREVRERTPRRFAFTSPNMREVEKLIAKVAVTDSTVLITGESGTGKGVVARQIHEQSERRSGPFVAVNCSAIPEHLLESELFGHIKGAFTGADRTRKGLFFEAHTGTLFLDEIGELPLQMQTKLLNVIEEKEIRPVGSENARRVDTRIITATNRNLKEFVQSGGFREDLFFRIGMFQIELPPLRERAADLPSLIRFLTDRIRSSGDTSSGARWDREAEATLLKYSWPGNVRELENVIQRACILASDKHICVDDLPLDLVRKVSGVRKEADVSACGYLRQQLRKVEKEILRRAIEDAAGDRKLAADRLGIGISSLYRKLED